MLDNKIFSVNERHKVKGGAREFQREATYKKTRKNIRSEFEWGELGLFKEEEGVWTESLEVIA